MGGRQDMLTPRWLFDLVERRVRVEVGERFRGFKLDPAATDASVSLCERYFTPEDDGLAQEWNDDAFNNPPFQNFTRWIEHCYMQAIRHDRIHAQIGPTGCSQYWFHSVGKHCTVWVPDQRIEFIYPETGKPGDTGANRDAMIFLFGAPFWNPNPATWKMHTLHCRGHDGKDV